MQRIAAQPRPDWRASVETQGLLFHTTDDGRPYWGESAYYEFTEAEVDQLEAATYELNRMVLAAVDHVIAADRWDDFGVQPVYRSWVRQSWVREDVTIVGRFDLAFDGSGPPVLLEYNADTPTGLLEAAVVQWGWLRQCHPDSDQFNSIHERLIEAWRRAAHEVHDLGRTYFVAAAGHVEDYVTVNYLRDTAMQAGLATDYLDMHRIGWSSRRRTFVDAAERPIGHAFKLYPWEWMFDERFGPHLPVAPTRWLEPPWKVLLSNKAILAVLWEMYPGHPNLLAASLSPLSGDVVRKPRQSREGANVTITRGGLAWAKTGGRYAGPHVWQRYVPVRKFDGQTPVIGSWMVNGYACGIGIREDESPITGNGSRFVPHLFKR